jgi:hypothetical protein
MSHNKIKIGTVEPDRTSEYSLDVNDLNDVTIATPTSGQFLTYDGVSAWENTSPAAITPGVIFAGEGASQNYSTSGAAGVSVSDDIEFYASSSTNTISGASITSASNWISSITLPAGTFRLLAVAGLELSASSGLVEYRWHDGTSLVGATGNAGYTDDRVGNPAVAVVTPTGSTTYTVQITTATSVVAKASQTARHAERGYLIVEEVR